MSEPIRAETQEAETPSPRSGVNARASMVDGIVAKMLVQPQSAAEVAEVVRRSVADGLSLVPSGAGTKLDWGMPPHSVDVLVDLRALNSVIAHRPGDLVVHVHSGISLAELQAVLAPAGQRLALDEVVPGSTVGGIIATGLSGPIRHRFGGVRDLLIGTAIVRADGSVARSGGLVVKNVAGYDLSKLYVGSFGTLGILTEAIFRLHPLPQSRLWLSHQWDDAQIAAVELSQLLRAQLDPAAIELQSRAIGSPIELGALIEGPSESVARRAEGLAALLGGQPSVSSQAPNWWGALPGLTTLKLIVPPGAVVTTLTKVQEAGAADGLALTLRASAGVGVLYAGFEDIPASVLASCIERLRAICTAAGGAAVVLRAPRAVKELVDVWGPVNGLSLMRRIKENFDPSGRLSPGRFVGGI